jgi:hypothetical protein
MNNKIVLLAIACLGSAGCATYVTPGSGVSLVEIADEDLRTYYETQPSSPFPANVAIVRVQDRGYNTRTVHGYGHGRYSVVTTRDIETDEALQKIVNLPLVSNVAPIGRLLLPPNASTMKDLRTPAAKLRADLLLVYSVDTSFTVEGKSLGPLSAISLGFIRNKKAHVTATVAGALIDVRTGFIYGTTEASATEVQRASVWSTGVAIESSRLRAETVAFEQFAAEFQGLWKGVVDIHAATQPRPSPQVADRDTHYRVRFEDRHD